MSFSFDGFFTSPYSALFYQFNVWSSAVCKRLEMWEARLFPLSPGPVVGSKFVPRRGEESVL